MRPPKRTLAGRMAAVQTAVSVIALAGVGVATTGTMALLLRSRADHLLLDVAKRVASTMERLPPETTDPRWIANETEEQRPAGARVEVRAANGALLGAVGEAFDLPPALVGCANHGPIRVCGASSPRFAVVAATPRDTDDAADRYLVLVLVGLSVAAGGLVATAGRRVARRALGPLSRLAARIEAVEPGAGERVTERTGLAELDVLASRFDDLLARFEEALERERRLAAQASHELRTPLTLARAEIEALAVRGADAGSIARALKAVDRLSELIEALLWFAKAQARLDDSRMDVVNLPDLLRAEVSVRQRSDPMPPIRCDLPEEALVRGDERLLGRVAANLVDNALKYGQGEPVEIRAHRHDSQLAVTILNAGRLASDARHRLFEPFYRGNGTSAQAAGFGLGLPFARAVARAHGGDVVLDDVRPDGTAFVLTLPLIAWTDASGSSADP